MARKMTLKEAMAEIERLSVYRDYADTMQSNDECFSATFMAADPEYKNLSYWIQLLGPARAHGGIVAVTVFDTSKKADQRIVEGYVHRFDDYFRTLHESISHGVADSITYQIKSAMDGLAEKRRKALDAKYGSSK